MEPTPSSLAITLGLFRNRVTAVVSLALGLVAWIDYLANHSAEKAVRSWWEELASWSLGRAPWYIAAACVLLLVAGMYGAVREIRKYQVSDMAKASKRLRESKRRIAARDMSAAELLLLLHDKFPYPIDALELLTFINERAEMHYGKLTDLDKQVYLMDHVVELLRALMREGCCEYVDAKREQIQMLDKGRVVARWLIDVDGARSWS